MRLLVLAAVLTFGTAALLPADDEEKFALPPRTVTMEMAHSNLGKIAAALSKQGGIPIALPDAASAAEPCDAIFNDKPFWFALEFTASQTGNRIVLRDGGRKIALEPRGKSYEVSSVHGPFRVVAREVVGRFLLDSGSHFHELHLDIHWEPRLPVFRLDSSPRIASAVDDKGRKLSAPALSARSQPTAAIHPATVRMEGIHRDAKRIAEIAGNFTVTASDKMLAFTFDDLTKGKTPVILPAKDKVAAILKRVEKDESTWEFEIELTYPQKLPQFESFESWTTENRMRLVSPGGRPFTTTDHEIQVNGSKVTALYRFREAAKSGLTNPASKGWKLVYDAPSPPLEFTVPFELKDIPLP
ncbi:MAG TPA: hypothetical protein VN641_14530 [Urbifossiella sp.]|nr:hypothetical protein [Urbifossiella sp.]